eukprot:jgi/Psemu1/314816/fgenesh1_kg.1715_\
MNVIDTDPIIIATSLATASADAWDSTIGRCIRCLSSRARLHRFKVDFDQFLRIESSETSVLQLQTHSHMNSISRSNPSSHIIIGVSIISANSSFVILSYLSCVSRYGKQSMNMVHFWYTKLPSWVMIIIVDGDYEI